MFRFTIRDVLWLTVVAIPMAFGTPVLAQEESKETPCLGNSSWVISEAYFGGEAYRDPVGYAIVMDRGKFTVVGETEIIDSIEIRWSKDAPEQRFEGVVNGRIIAKALAIRGGDGMLTIYQNSYLGGLGGGAEIRDPVPDKRKCHFAVMCRPISEAEGRARLEAANKGGVE